MEEEKKMIQRPKRHKAFARKAVFQALVNLTDEQGIQPCVPDIAARAGYSKHHVVVILRALEQEGYVARERTSGTTGVSILKRDFNPLLEPQYAKRSVENS